LQFHLLIRRQLVLDANRHPHVQGLYLAFRVEHFAQLGQRLLLVNLGALHGFVQRFHRVLQLPLELIETRGRALNLAAHESLLIVGQRQLALMLHDHLRRKHVVRQRIVRRPGCTWLHLLAITINRLRGRLRGCRLLLR
jgi:hypothetical protein